jgi:hypothetical protein
VEHTRDVLRNRVGRNEPHLRRKPRLVCKLRLRDCSHGSQCHLDCERLPPIDGYVSPDPVLT